MNLLLCSSLVRKHFETSVRGGEEFGSKQMRCFILTDEVLAHDQEYVKCNETKGFFLSLFVKIVLGVSFVD
jgi:hypothetical protein